MNLKENKIEYILRQSEPFDKNRNERYDNEDLSTLFSSKVFEGASLNFNIVDSKLTSAESSYDTLFGYDVASDIDSILYVRYKKTEPGKLYEEWLAPTEKQWDNIIEYFQIVYKDDKQILQNTELYKNYIKFKRNLSLNNILEK